MRIDKVVIDKVGRISIQYARRAVGIWLRPLGNATCVACLLLLYQGSKWLNDKSVVSD